jgi:hypothetical protein
MENKQRDQRQPRKKRKPSHFPGAFFGFGPEPKENNEATSPKKKSPTREGQKADAESADS